MELLRVQGQLGSSRIHSLAVFPPDTKASQIDRIYSTHAGTTPFPADEDRTGKEEFKLDGTHPQTGRIFIAAHIDEPRTGLRARFRATREGSTIPPYATIRKSVTAQISLPGGRVAGAVRATLANALASGNTRRVHTHRRTHQLAAEKTESVAG